jgi:hypothetical protein
VRRLGSRAGCVGAQNADSFAPCCRAAAGPAQLLRIAAAAALTPMAQEDRHRSKVKLAGELWGLAAWRPGGLAAG